MPPIPRKTYMSNKFDPEVIENRRREFQEFLTMYFFISKLIFAKNFHTSFNIDWAIE